MKPSIIDALTDKPRIAPEFAHRAVARQQWDNPLHLILFLVVFWGLVALGLWWWLV